MPRHGTLSEPRGFEVTGTSAAKLLWVLLPLLAGVALSLYATGGRMLGDSSLQGVSLSPPWYTAGGAAGWSVLVLLALALLFAWTFFNRRIQLHDGTLEVRSTFYRRRVKVADLLLDQATQVDLTRDRRFALRFKTNGFALPGFHSGHYRLRGGGKGFVLITDIHQVLALPVRDGSTLLLSVEQPQQLLDALRRA